MQRHIWARLAGAGALMVAALLGGAGPAQADPPPGWGAGQYGVEYDFADVLWTHHGRYHDAPGNWHTGWVNVEEDDDGITGELIDWRCPAGVKPPSISDYDQITSCTQKGSLWLEYNQYYDVAQYDQARNRLEVHIDVPAYDENYTQVTTVQIELTIQGRGEPVITSDESGEILDFTETFADTKARGKVNGHRVRGPNTVQGISRMGYWLDGWERTT